jgi:hypothetical protein
MPGRTLEIVVLCIERSGTAIVVQSTSDIGLFGWREEESTHVSQ